MPLSADFVACKIDWAVVVELCKALVWPAFWTLLLALNRRELRLLLLSLDHLIRRMRTVEGFGLKAGLMDDLAQEAKKDLQVKTSEFVKGPADDPETRARLAAELVQAAARESEIRRAAQELTQQASPGELLRRSTRITPGLMGTLNGLVARIHEPETSVSDLDQMASHLSALTEGSRTAGDRQAIALVSADIAAARSAKGREGLTSPPPDLA